MFLLKAIQDKCLYTEEDDDVAFVLFNVKGKDLLALDEPNDFESDAERKSTYALYPILTSELLSCTFPKFRYTEEFSDITSDFRYCRTRSFIRHCFVLC